MVAKCEHYFCRECIESWLSGNFTCPIDRKTLEKKDLRNPQRLMKTLLRKRVLTRDLSLKNNDSIEND